MAILHAHSLQLVGMALLLALSGFFSGSETALFALRPEDRRQLRLSSGLRYTAVLRLCAQPSEFLATVLFSNMLVNISFYSLASGLSSTLGREFGHEWQVLFSLGALLLVIIFGEVTPKALAVLAPQAYILAASVPMYTLHRCLTPMRVVMRRVTGLLRHVTRHAPAPAERNFEELKLMLEVAADDGELTRLESALISEVIDLTEVKVKECMTPRVDLIMVEEAEGRDAVLALARETGKTKIPVYRGVRDDLVGVIDVRDLYLDRQPGALARSLQEPVYVSVYQRVSQTLRFLQRQRTDLAFVVDEYGGTAGIVTLSDVLEEVFGRGDDAAVFPSVQSLGEEAFLLAGDVSLREWRQLLGFTDTLPTVDTVGGLVSGLLGRVPQVGDAIYLGRIEMRVEAVSHRRVLQVRLCIRPDETAGGEA